MTYDYYPEEEPEEEFVDKDFDSTNEAILRVIGENKVVTDRELKVRLENPIFPWIIERTLKKQLEEGTVVKMKLPGRRSTSARITEGFYVLDGTKYDDVQDIMRRKRDVTIMINNTLTGTSLAGDHAEDLFINGFRALGFTIHDRDVSEFKGRKVTGEQGKVPPNVDFLAERDKIVYGIDVKNWIRYEFDNRKDIEEKISVALQLRTVPFIAARYVDNETISNIHKANRAFGMTYRYDELLLPQDLVSLAASAKKLLGYPILATDRLPKYKLDWIEKLHQIRLKKGVP